MQRLAVKGFRLTPQREHVYRVLLQEREHPTAEQVFMRAKKSLPDISMATVYNCLDFLVKCSLVKEVNLDRTAMRYCPNMHEHCHFHCDECGGVFDIDFCAEDCRAELKLPNDFQKIIYYSAPKKRADGPKSLEEVDPRLLETYEKLGIPLKERERLAGVAVDAVFDSVSVGTTFKEKLAEKGVIFCSFSEAVQEHPELIKKHLGSVVPYSDNFYATLNSAVFSDGSFCYIPKGVRSPMELSTYFRINALNTGQFERTLIIAEEGAYVSYLEGCTAPMRDENQLHAAVVELIALDRAEIKYSTVQNWYPGDAEGKGGIYNFVTKRGLCKGRNSKIAWTQVETGSAITWKYPSCVLQGENSVGEFYSVAVTNNYQQADTGTKMVHIGRK